MRYFGYSEQFHLERLHPPISSIQFSDQIRDYFVLFKKCFNCK